MGDFVYVALTLGFFAASWAMIVMLERLMEDKR